VYNTRHLIILTAFLLTLGLGLFLYKFLWLGLPLKPDAQTPIWNIEAELTFYANRPVRATLFVPPDQENFKIIEENFVAGKYGVTTSSTPSGRNRVSEWTRRNPTGAQTLYYQVLINKTNDLSTTSGPGISLEKQTIITGARGDAAKTIVDNTYIASKDSVSLATGVVKQLRANADGNTNFLLQSDNSPANVASTAVQVLKGRVAAQVVHGIYLADEFTQRREVPMETLLRVWDGEKNVWLYINPDTGKQGLPDGFFIWYYGDSPLLAVDGGSYPQVSFALSKELKNTLQLANRNELRAHSWMLDYSLFSLPLQTQLAYQVLIMIPLGALIVLMVRNVIGMPTFGTFMPVLIALAFRETQLINGIFLFSFIVGLGLLVRFYFEQLKLLLIPRLSAVLSAVILIILVISIISHRLDVSFGLSIAIFPIVIITMTIERMSVVWEEHGGWAAIKQGMGSLFSASLAYLAMVNPMIEHVFFVYPEFILFLMAAMLWLGRYRGYRLTELFRFNTLFEKGVKTK
jgi:hypothetical protein